MSLHQFLKHVLNNPWPADLSTEALAAFIYENYFVCRKKTKKGKPTDQEQERFIRQLYQSNTCLHNWVSLPLIGSHPEGTVFALGDLNILAGKQEWRRSRPHQYHEVKLPTYCIEEKKWYRFFAGDFHQDLSVPLARIYFNCSPQGATLLLNILSKVVTKDAVSFGLKIATNLEHYNCRNDSCILYYKRGEEIHLSKHINKVVKALTSKKDCLRPESLPLTCKLADGVCYAEDPKDGSCSFGMHRCRLIAQGMSRLHTKIKFEMCYPNILQIWKDNGLLPEKPWLTP